MRDRRLESDAAWMYAGFAVQALAGVGLHICLAAISGAVALGVFAQLLAIYLIGGQLCAMGAHDSTQRHVAAALAVGKPAAPVAIGGTALGAAGGALGAVALVALAGVLGRILESTRVANALPWLAPGLGLFVVNKVLLAVFNGARRMRTLAAAQTVRALALFVFVVGVVGADLSLHWLGAAFTAAEACVTLTAVSCKPWQSTSVHLAEARKWVRQHLGFAIRAWPQGALSETFIRVDTVVLGLMLADARVGVYALAAVFFEGLWALAVLSRSIANPVLVTYIVRYRARELARLVKRLGAANLAVLALAVVALNLGFPWLRLVVAPATVEQARDALLILSVGILVYAPMAPFEQVLIQAGRPGVHSALSLVFIVLNVVLNRLWIPEMGIVGAAAATAVSFAVSGMVYGGATAWVQRSLRESGDGP